METKSEITLNYQDELAIVRFNEDPQYTFILNDNSLPQLSKILDKIRGENLKGVIFLNSNSKIFCAGADIKSIASVTEVSKGEELAKKGQEIFDKIAALSFPSCAVISGACVGGGCELVLACTYRIITEDSFSRIGLPEIKLGIIPGFGGTQRLPRLIGLPKALDVILKGKVVDASEAYNLGLVDKIILGMPKEGIKLQSNASSNISTLSTDAATIEKRFIAEAKEFLLAEKSSRASKINFTDKLLTFTKLGRSIVSKKAQAKIFKDTKGHYPAPIKALEVAVSGLGLPLAEGLRQEALGLGQMIVTPESKSLISLYFLGEDAKKLGRGAKGEIKGIRVGVIGAGTMGSGIAGVFLQKGYSVLLSEISDKVKERSKDQIKKILSKGGKVSEDEITRKFSNLKYVSSISELRGVNLVIEAVIEDLNAKKKVFAELREKLGDEVILATNTSSIPLKDISENISGKDNFVGIHFFNPVEKMPLVEVIATNESSNRAISWACAISSELGKSPIVVADSPGFLANRILIPYLVEAAFLINEGYSFKDIDNVAEEFGMPMGPVRLLDEIGLEVAARVSEIVQAAYGERMLGPTFANDLAVAGRLGRKSGKGFYKYEDGRAVEDESVYQIINVQQKKGTLTLAQKIEIQERLFFSMLNEAVRALDDETAGVISKEAVGQIDLCTVLGFGFPPFRGGLMRYAKGVGIKEIVSKLESLKGTRGDRFQPAPGLLKRVASGLDFSNLN